MGYGFVLIIAAAIVNYFTANLLVLACEKTGKIKYFDLSKDYGKVFTMFVKLVFFLNNWGIVVGYTTLINILIASSLKILFGD